MRVQYGRRLCSTSVRNVDLAGLACAPASRARRGSRWGRCARSPPAARAPASASRSAAARSRSARSRTCSTRSRASLLEVGQVVPAAGRRGDRAREQPGSAAQDAPHGDVTLTAPGLAGRGCSMRSPVSLPVLAAGRRAAPRRAGHRARRAPGHRPPRRVRLPARAYARLLRARRPHGRRLHRAGPRLHQGRRAGRAARERDRRHHGRRGPSRVRRPPDHEDDRRHRAHRLVHRGLHARRAQDAAREGAHPGHPPAQHALRRALPHPDLPGGHQPHARPARSSSGAASASTPRPSTRRTSSRSASRSSRGWWRR